MPKLKSINVSLSLPYIGGIEGTWEPDEAEQRAAWEMYIELITRISIADLKPDEGLLREALSSLYSLFNTTRNILRQHGPSVARPKGKSNLSFGFLAVAVLNGVLRPMLARWHPLLLDYESSKPVTISAAEHEAQWVSNEPLRQDLNSIRLILIEYANLLADVAEVPSLIIQKDEM